MASASTPHLYVIALGSNRSHGRHGRPQAVLAAAIAHLARHDIDIIRQSAIITSAPVGPSLRRYANAAVLVRSPLPPPALLHLLKQVERDFGRRRGQRWGSRVLDLDIILWSGGRWASRQPLLTIPHPLWSRRDFVAGPVAEIAADWRDPVTHRSVRHHAARLRRPRPRSS